MICNKVKDCYENSGIHCSTRTSCLKQCDKRKNVTCEENKKRYNLINKNLYKITVYHMDGGIVHNEPNANKCDYLYGVNDTLHPTAIFIELKGRDIPHALEQVKSSITNFAHCFHDHRIYARIICKSVPRLFNDPSIQNYNKLLRKKYSGNLVIKETNFDEDYLKL